MKRLPTIAILVAAELLFAVSGLTAGGQPAETALPAVLGLEDAQRLALKDSPSISTAEARIRQARAIVRQTEARFLPTISVRGSWSEGELPDRLFASSLLPAGTAVNDREGAIQLFNSLQTAEALNPPDTEKAVEALRATYLDATIGDEELTAYWVGAQASWLVFDGFSRMFRRAAAIHGKEQTLSAKLDAERLTLGAVAAAFCQAQLAREQITIAQTDFDFNTRLVNELTARNEVGKRSLDDVLNFQVRKDVAEAGLLEARRQYESSLTGLAALMALPDAGFPDTVELAPLAPEREEELNPPDLDGEIVYALAHRPDLAAARAVLDRQRETVGIARSTYSPTVRFNAGYDGVRQEDIHFADSDFGWNVMLTVSADLFCGGARLALVDQTLAARAAAEAALAKAELNAASEVRNAHSGLVSAADQLRLQAHTVETVERSRELAENEYMAGQMPPLRLNEAQSQTVAARSRQASALATLHVAWQMLQQATARSVALPPK